MALTLTTLRCPEAAAPETRRAGGGEYSIGRGPDNDWVLPDPERHLSKRHCVLAYRAGEWQVADLSANGTFVNRESEAIGAGAPRRLRSGDRLRLGAYEIEVTVTDDQPAPRRAEADPFAFETPPSQWGDRPDPLLQPPSNGHAVGVGHGLSTKSVQLSPGFDPLLPEEDFWSGPSVADHSPATSDAFRPPPLADIPDDWLDGIGAAPPVPAQPPSAPPSPQPMPPSPPQIPRVDPSPPHAGDAALLAAFLRGAQLDGVAPPDPAHTMEIAGAALRATIAGIRQALIARASIKGEFRIEQTMVQARGNNPLKFSADDDDAMAAFLGLGRRTAMPGDQAVTEALRDIRLHELATMNAMQVAVRAMLMQLDPGTIERTVEGGVLTKLPGQRKAQAWDAYEAAHQRITQGLQDDFDSVFGKAFARAYEQAMQDALNRENPS